MLSETNCAEVSGFRVSGVSVRRGCPRTAEPSPASVQGVWLRLATLTLFRPEFVFMAHGLVYHSNLGWRVIQRERRVQGWRGCPRTISPSLDSV